MGSKKEEKKKKSLKSSDNSPYDCNCYTVNKRLMFGSVLDSVLSSSALSKRYLNKNDC